MIFLHSFFFFLVVVGISDIRAYPTCSKNILGKCLTAHSKIPNSYANKICLMDNSTLPALEDLKTAKEGNMLVDEVWTNLTANSRDKIDGGKLWGEIDVQGRGGETMCIAYNYVTDKFIFRDCETSIDFVCIEDKKPRPKIERRSTITIREENLYNIPAQCSKKGDIDEDIQTTIRWFLNETRLKKETTNKIDIGTYITWESLKKSPLIYCLVIRDPQDIVIFGHHFTLQPIFSFHFLMADDSPVRVNMRSIYFQLARFDSLFVSRSINVTKYNHTLLEYRRQKLFIKEIEFVVSSKNETILSRLFHHVIADKGKDFGTIQPYVHKCIWWGAKIDQTLESICIRNGSSINFVHCICRRLEFKQLAIYLGNRWSPKINPLHPLLKFIVDVGFFFSFFSFAFVILSYFVLNDWPKVIYNRILVYHSLVLLVTFIPSVISFNNEYHPLRCKYFTVFIHYSCISTLIWATIEGIACVFIFTRNQDPKDLPYKLFLYLGIASVVIPSLYVVPFVVFKFDIYINEQYCFFSAQGLLVGLLPPLSLTLFINKGMLLYIAFQNRQLFDFCRNLPKTPKDAIDRLVVLVTLLDFLWIFGLLAIVSSGVLNTIFVSIFCFQSFYGLVFLGRCLNNDLFISDWKQFMENSVRSDSMRNARVLYNTASGVDGLSCNDTTEHLLEI